MEVQEQRSLGKVAEASGVEELCVDGCAAR